MAITVLEWILTAPGVHVIKKMFDEMDFCLLYARRWNRIAQEDLVLTRTVVDKGFPSLVPCEDRIDVAYYFALVGIMLTMLSVLEPWKIGCYHEGRLLTRRCQ